MNFSSTPRVRFAPSPTGYLHIGGLRTALYNYLFARRNQGAFILRIEDTDRSRFVEGAVENLIKILRWAGLDFDEGPGIIGKFGPYVQSERLSIYHRYAEELLRSGNAYRCFCTQEELGVSRLRQSVEKGASMYNRRCRALTPDQIHSKLAENIPHTLRMKVPFNGALAFYDLIRGEINVPYEVIDDQVLIKSDGFPTYHFANVVDDHLMKITHVIRGEEWLPSTAKHILLYQYFGWETPQFAHLPLLLNPDRSKLSKRQGDVAVEDYRAKGYLPEALINFVALLGWNTPDDQEIFSMTELIEKFSLDRVGKAGTIFNIDKLQWFNQQYIHKLPAERIARLCLPYIEREGYEIGDSYKFEKVIDAIKSYLTFPSDIIQFTGMFFDSSVHFEDENAIGILGTESAQSVLRYMDENFDNVIVWDRNTVKEFIKTVQKQTGIKGKDLFLPIRIALTGRQHGPDLPVIAEIYGKEKCKERIHMARLLK